MKGRLWGPGGRPFGLRGQGLPETTQTGQLAWVEQAGRHLPVTFPSPPTAHSGSVPLPMFCGAGYDVQQTVEKLQKFLGWWPREKGGG